MSLAPARPEPDDPEHVRELTDEQVDAVLAVAASAARADGVAPLSEAALLRVRHADGVEHLLARSKQGTLAGYAQLYPADSTAELVVDPVQRHRAYGRALLRALLRTAGRRELRVWAHGQLPAATALAASMGFERARELFQLRRPLAGPPLPEPAAPAGVAVRRFRPVEDDERWVELNRRAFATHPEQGRWTLDDLRLRMAEPWFDATGFFLAADESDGRLLGFHWTKVHGSDEDTGEPIGEVYVLGVDPAAQGRGLGKFLTLVGLHHLRDRGLGRVLLYVDADNRAAVEVYRKLGFEPHATDVMFRH